MKMDSVIPRGPANGEINKKQNRDIINVLMTRSTTNPTTPMHKVTAQLEVEPKTVHDDRALHDTQRNQGNSSRTP